MKETRILEPECPIDELLNKAQKILGTKTRTETIFRVGASPSMITRIRRGQREPSAEFILRFHDVTGISIADIRSVGKISKLD